MKNFHIKKSVPKVLIAAGLLVMLLAVSQFSSCVTTDASAKQLNVALSTLAEENFLPWNGSTVRKPYLDCIYEYIAYIDPETSEPIPGLAESWKYSDDGRTVTLFIRKGIQFQQGWGEFSAEDVKFSIDRMLDPSAVGGQASALRMAVASVEAAEKYKAVITLKAPDPVFVQGYLGNGVAIPMACKKYIEEMGEDYANDNPVGTGAYTLGGHVEGTSVSVQKVEGMDEHWRVKPEFDTINFLAVSDEAERVAMLKNGDIDLAPINCSSITEVEQAGLETVSIYHNYTAVLRFGGTSGMYPNPDVPWAKKEVRQALNYAVDRDKLINEVLKGEGDPAGIDPDANEFKDIKAYPYDPAKAKALLAQAGYPDGFDVTIMAAATIPGAELPMLSEMVAAQWNEIGIRAEVKEITNAEIREAWTTGKYTDVIWTHRTYPCSNLVTSFLVMNSTRSPHGSFSNEDTDKRIMSIAMETDPDLRLSKIQEMAQWLNDEGASIYLVHGNEPYGISSKVGNWPAINQNVTNFDQISFGSR